MSHTVDSASHDRVSPVDGLEGGTVSPTEGPIRRIALGAGTTFAAKVANTGLKFATQIVLCRLLGADSFGLYALCIVLYQIGELVASMGLDSGTVRYVSIHSGDGDARKLRGVLIQAALLPFFAGLILGGLLFLGADMLANNVFGKPGLATPLRIVAAGLPFGATMTVVAFATTGFGVTRYLAYVWTLHPAVNLALAILLCAVGFELEGATAAWVGACIVGAAFAFHCLRRAWPAILDRGVRPIFEARRLLSFSIPLAFGNFLWLVLLWTDILLLAYFRPAAEVGIYRATSQTSLLLTLIIVSMNTIFAPTIAALLNKGASTEIRDVFRTSTRWSLMATVPIFLLLAVAGGDVLRIFGPDFQAGALPLLALAVGQLVTAGTGSCGQMLAMSGHQYLKLFGDLAMAVGNVVLNLLFIPRWGMLGAAMATGISIAAVHLLRLGQVYVVLRVSPYHRPYWKIVAAGIVAGISGFCLRFSCTGLHFLASLTLTALVIVVVYGAFLWVMRLEPEDRTLLKDGWAFLRRFALGTRHV